MADDRKLTAIALLETRGHCRALGRYRGDDQDSGRAMHCR